MFWFRPVPKSKAFHYVLAQIIAKEQDDDTHKWEHVSEMLAESVSHLY